MRINKKTKVLLVNNPLTGNDSFSKALGVEGDKTFSTPNKERIADKKQWEDYTKYVLFRLPHERFNSGATLFFNSTYDDWKSIGASDKFIEEVTAEGDSCLSLLKAIEKCGFDEAPIYLRPQKLWLSAKYDVVVATHNIAEWCNLNGNFTVRSNIITRRPSFKTYLLRASHRHKGDYQLFVKLYKEDLELAEKVEVWTPLEDEVRLVTGYCALCKKKKQEAKPKRARGKGGKFKADNPNTEEVNEAWEGGKSPKPNTKARQRRNNKA